MSSYEQTVDTLASAITGAARWVVADESLIEAIHRDQDVIRGRQGKILNRILAIAEFLHVALLAVAVTGVVGAFRSWGRRQRASRPSEWGGDAARPRTVSVFVGFGARAEEALFSTYSKRVGGAVFRIDETRLAVTGGAVAPGLIDLWSAVMVAVREVRDATAAMPSEFVNRRLDVLTSSSRRIGSYAYARAWWRSARGCLELRNVCFLAASETAFAAVAEGVQCSYLQHGLLAKTLVFPDFIRVYPMTHYEGEYMRRRLPHAQVHEARTTPADAVCPRKSRLLIASADRPHEEMMLAAPLISYLATLGVTTHVRLFASETTDRFWAQAGLGVPVVIENARESFEEVMDRLQPVFVASWGSTVLVEALYRGVIPITVAPRHDRYVEATVYPLLRCCLRWPVDQDVIRQVFESSNAYDRAVEHLRSRELSP